MCVRVRYGFYGLVRNVVFTTVSCLVGRIICGAREKMMYDASHKSPFIKIAWMVVNLDVEYLVELWFAFGLEITKVQLNSY